MTKKSEDSNNAKTPNLNIAGVSNRFSIAKTILSDFALFAIIDNEQNK